MAARNPVAGGSSPYMHSYQLQGRYIPAHHNVMVSRRQVDALTVQEPMQR